MPEGATSGPCDFAVKAIIAGQFEFPEDTELVSAVYAISASRRLNKPVMLEIEHCVEIKSERHCDYLSFGIARCNQHPLPYTFELEGGMFSPKSSYGAVLRSSFSMIAVGFRKFFGWSNHSDAPENRYSAQMFLETQGERAFSWKFVVGKDLKALASVSLSLIMEHT